MSLTFKLNLLIMDFSILVGHCMRSIYSESNYSIHLLHRTNDRLFGFWLFGWQVSFYQKLKLNNVHLEWDARRSSLLQFWCWLLPVSVWRSLRIGLYLRYFERPQDLHIQVNPFKVNGLFKPRFYAQNLIVLHFQAFLSLLLLLESSWSDRKSAKLPPSLPVSSSPLDK